MASFLGSFSSNPGHTVPAQRLHGQVRAGLGDFSLPPSEPFASMNQLQLPRTGWLAKSGFLTSPRLRVGRETPKGNQNTLTRKEPRTAKCYAGKRELSPSQSYLEIKTDLDGLLLKRISSSTEWFETSIVCLFFPMKKIVLGFVISTTIYYVLSNTEYLPFWCLQTWILIN